jgi:Inner membrane component of T3SS, cytoplasmic domain
MFPKLQPPRVVKRCPEGHVMQMAWRTCPRCTGARPETEAPTRDATEMTVILGAPPVARPAPVAAAPPTWVALLTAASGPESGRRIEIQPGRWKLGKAPREEAGFTVVQVHDSFMSRDHFALEAGTAAVVLRDLGSTNGTFANDSRVERHILAEGDLVRAGETTFRVSLAPRGPAS